MKVSDLIFQNQNIQGATKALFLPLVRGIEDELEQARDVLSGLRDAGLIHDVVIRRHRPVGGTYGESAKEAVYSILGDDCDT